MSARGLRIVRFRGRYFIYYNNYDNCPKGLGIQLVSEIPTDPEKYKGTLNTLTNFLVEQYSLLPP